MGLFTNEPVQTAKRPSVMELSSGNINRLKAISDACASEGFALKMLITDQGVACKMGGHSVVITTPYYELKDEKNLSVPTGKEVAPVVEDYAKKFVIQDEVLKLQKAALEEGVLTTTKVKEIEDRVSETFKSLGALRTALANVSDVPKKNIAEKAKEAEKKEG